MIMRYNIIFFWLIRKSFCLTTHFQIGQGFEEVREKRLVFWSQWYSYILKKLVSPNILFHASTCSLVMQHSTGMNPGRCVNEWVCTFWYVTFPQTDSYHVIFYCKLPIPMHSEGDSGTKSVSICFLFICKVKLFSLFMNWLYLGWLLLMWWLCMFSSEFMGYYSHCSCSHHY